MFQIRHKYVIIKAIDMAEVAQLVEPSVVIRIVAGSSPVFRPISRFDRIFKRYAGVAELVDALDLGSSILRCVGSSPSTRTT